MLRLALHRPRVMDGLMVGREYARRTGAGFHFTSIVVTIVQWHHRSTRFRRPHGHLRVARGRLELLPKASVTGLHRHSGPPLKVLSGHRPYERTCLPLRPRATDKLNPPFTACTCHGQAFQESARHRPWRLRAASPTRHQKMRVGDLCLAVQGSHRAYPGDLGGALQARRTVPTARRREFPISGRREGVKVSLKGK